MTLASEGGQNKLVNGSISIVFLKDPDRPEVGERRGDEALPPDHEAYAPGANPNDVYHVYGMAVGLDGRRALKKAGKNLTRAGPREGRRRDERLDEPVPAAGDRREDGRGRPFPIEQMLLQRWQKGSWKSFGGLWGYRGASSGPAAFVLPAYWRRGASGGRRDERRVPAR